ncbi:MAG: VCBS repeat-containing protein [Planctomycetaceae bacterium]|nr:VCBS repeat-containing protein [Planctomycetaceae bacterium]
MFLSSNQAGPEAAYQLAGYCFSSGAITAAERCYLYALEHGSTPDFRLAYGQFLFSIGRVYDARSVWEPLLRHGGMDLLSMPRLGNDDLTFEPELECIRQARNHKDDVAAVLARAHLMLQSRQVTEARQLLEQHFEAGCDRTQFRELWGECLSLSGETSQLWKFLVDHGPPESPEEWCLAGRATHSQGRIDESIRCYLEAVQLDPACQEASNRLAELYRIRHRHEEAEFFRNRADLLKQYSVTCRVIHSSEDLPTEASLKSAATLSRSAGAFRECVAWCDIAAAVFPAETWMVRLREECLRDIRPEDGRFSETDPLWAQIRPKEFPLPRWHQRFATPQVTEQSPVPIQFEDRAIDVGIDFVYRSGYRSVEQSRFFEFTGGGVAVIDLDQDLWPDVFFSQGGSSPRLGRPSDNDPEKSQPEEEWPSDALFRNHRGQSFHDVAQLSGLTDSGYSQGCTAGDCNLDGFQDLYVANIGSNALMINNGDGTFTHSEFSFPDVWTTSCAIADLTGDGIPDIYDVNHMAQDGIHEKMCRSGDAAYPCDLSKMKPEQDRLWMGQGDGDFLDMTFICGIEQPEGTGLGLLVGDLDGVGDLEIFVANDAKPNFLFVRHPDSRSQSVSFTNEAALRGLAVSAEGRSQACMGVAAGDADGDGTTDLFITNFFADYNTLYLQRVSPFFSDCTLEKNLYLPSWNRLGFGAQFLDADMDGRNEIVLTNGDVADFSSTNPSRPFQQCSQLLRNSGTGAFVEADAAKIGSFFSRPVLGRGLASLDWNRDGRPDFVVSCMDSQAALVTNASDVPSGASLRMIGTSSPREPIGCQLSIETEHRQSLHSLMTGDGYQCRNSTVILVAAPQGQPYSVRIKWPGTMPQAFTTLQTDLLIPEGRDALSAPQ